MARLGDTVANTLEKAFKNTLPEIQLGRHRFKLGERTLIMGILNVTPDSFSDGGRFDHIDNALAQAYRMAEEGADIIDIGGESTRPGYEKVGLITAAEELERVLPVITALKNERSFKLPLSIDTYKAETAEKALDAGVEMLNDVWGFKEDLKIASVAANYEVPVCLMHNRRSTEYNHLIADIFFELQESVELARKAGIDDSKIILDPGIGFGKDYSQNLEVMHHLKEFCSLGFPLLLGTSRKSIVGKTLNLPADDRIEGTAATVSYGIIAGADIIRVHDVKQMKRVAVMTDALVRR
jgi:dihydropteroate synthase